MASSTEPDLFFINDPVVENVAGTILPILKSYTLLWFGLLRTNTCVLVLPHATVSVVGMIRTSINRAARDVFPTALRADKVPYGCVIDPAAY